MKYVFNNSDWRADFTHAFSLVTKGYTEFIQECDHIWSGYNEESKDYDYVTIVHKDVFAKGSKVSVKCSFDSYGAPLLTFTDDLYTDDEGRVRYGTLYEVVAYEDGCNVWYLTKNTDPNAKRPYNVTSCLKLRFPIEAKSIVDMSVEILDKCLRVKVNDIGFDIPAPYLPKNFRIGITGCEGVNRFYEAELVK